MQKLRRIPIWLAIVLLIVAWYVAQFAIGYAIAPQKRMVALDVNTGQVLWVRPGAFTRDIVVEGDYPNGGTASHRVFVQTLQKRGRDKFLWNVAALDAKTGETQWQSPTRTLTDSFLAITPLYAHAGNLYYATIGTENQPGRLIALDVTTGELRWQIDRTWDVFQSFQDGLDVVARGDRLVYLSYAPGNKVRLQAVDPATAKPIWQVNLNELDYFDAIYDSTLLAGDRTVVLQDYRGIIRGYDLATGKLQFTIPLEDGVKEEIQLVDDSLYSRFDLQVVAFDSTTGKERWRRGGTYEQYSGCDQSNARIEFLRATAERIYATCNDIQGTWLMVLNPADGQRAWLKRIAPQPSLNISRTSGALQAVPSKVVLIAMGAATAIDTNRLLAHDVITGAEKWRFVRSDIDEDLTALATDGDRVFTFDEVPRWYNWIARVVPSWGYGR